MIDSQAWRTFLHSWSEAQRESGALASSAIKTARGASEKQLESLQQRLGLVLPPSYAAFLRASNGCGKTTSSIERIRPAKEVDWFDVENEQWIEAYSIAGPDDIPDEIYFAYGPSSVQFRPEHLKRAVQISDVGDGVYLLIPDAVTEDGEWEVWFFANWIPGAHRYPSFAELMKAEYRTFRLIELKDAMISATDGSYSGPAAPDRPRGRATAVPGAKAKRKAASITELVVSLESPNLAERKKAAAELGGRIRVRDGTRILPQIVDPLARALANDPSVEVRCAAASALGEFGDERALPPLCAALSDADQWVALSAVFALGYHRNAVAVEPLCRFAERNPSPHVLNAIMGVLSQLADPRCLATVLRVMRETADLQTLYSAALAAGSVGSAATPALVELLKNEKPILRAAAAAALQQTGDRSAIEPLRNALSDPDPDVQLKARIALSILEAGVGGAAGGIQGALQRTLQTIQATGQLDRMTTED